MVDSADEDIIALAERSIAAAGLTGGGLLARARILRQTARRHITHSTLATGFASASETVRSREGDCTEHAMLLAALLRADHIPSRVCTGVVYSEGGQVQAAADSKAAGNVVPAGPPPCCPAMADRSDAMCMHTAMRSQCSGDPRESLALFSPPPPPQIKRRRKKERRSKNNKSVVVHC